MHDKYPQQCSNQEDDAGGSCELPIEFKLRNKFDVSWFFLVFFLILSKV